MYKDFLLRITYIYEAPFHISKTSGDVKQQEGKPVTLFKGKDLSVSHTFHVI